MSKLELESCQKVTCYNPGDGNVSHSAYSVVQSYLENCMLDAINFSNEYLAYQWQGYPESKSLLEKHRSSVLVL